MKLFIFSIIMILIPLVYILILKFLSPANKGKLICPVDNCFRAFADEHEYLEHLREDHREYFDNDHVQYEDNVW